MIEIRVAAGIRHAALGGDRRFGTGNRAWHGGALRNADQGGRPEPEPDVWLARVSDEAERTHPGIWAMALVVEVSWSSSYHDRVRKLPLYGAAGVPEYWIVDLHREVVVHVHRGPAGDGYREVFTAARGDVLTVPGTDLTVDVNELLGP